MIDIPPINVLELARSNIVQSLLAVFIAGMIGASQRQWVTRIVYTVLAILPAFFTMGIVLEVVSSQNWRYGIAMVLLAIGTWVTAKESNTAVKK